MIDSTAKYEYQQILNTLDDMSAEVTDLRNACSSIQEQLKDVIKLLDNKEMEKDSREC